MTRSRRLAALAAALALVFPAAALADGAGDQQYQDPFGNTAPQKQKPKKNSTPTAPSQPAPSQGTPAPSSQPSASASPTASSTQPAAASRTSASAKGQLPRTGLDLRVIGGVGLLLVAAGVLLRRRLA
jgi:hypothetical protein